MMRLEIYRKSIIFVILILQFLKTDFAYGTLNKISNAVSSGKAIIFIHGLNSNSHEAWTNKNGFYFPEGFSNESEFQGFDIYTFDYPSACNVVTPLEAANKLKDELGQLKQKYVEINFVAHSLGGIVVREFLLLAGQQKNVKSIHLLATPNLGSSYELLASEFCKLVGVGRVKTLGTGRGTNIDLLNDRWRSFYEQNDGIKTFHFYAAYEVPQGLFPITIVDKDSALLFSSKVTYFPTGHMGISKPENNSDEIYRWVKDNLLNKLQADSHVQADNEMRELRINWTKNILEKTLRGLSRKSAVEITKAINLRSIEQAYKLIEKNNVPMRDSLLLKGSLFALKNQSFNALPMFLRADLMEGEKVDVELYKNLVHDYCKNEKNKCRSNQSFDQLGIGAKEMNYLNGIMKNREYENIR